MNKTVRSGSFNPFLPLDVYIPDGEPKVFGDRLYLYGSKDIWGGEYCCHKYHVYSAPLEDLESWTDHGPVLASTDEYVNEGISDGISWSDGLLWAPDIAFKDGWYYLYFCLSDGTEGVAKSRYPYGPFTDAKQIMMDNEPVMGIDPSVLETEDGYYYTWGQGDCRMAKLNEDMCTLDKESYCPSLISRKDGAQGFHEGSSLRKLGDYYCIVYASEYKDEYPNKGTAPVKLDYAVSKNIYGPYRRRGTIIDNTGVDPSSWNNHGSIIKVKDQWYVFYHGSSNNCKYTRRARAERLEVDEEHGFIRKASMTSSGFAQYLDFGKVEAPYAYNVTGGAFFTQREDGFPMTAVKDGCSASYRYYNFKEDSFARISLSLTAFEEGAVHILVNNEQKARIEFKKSTQRQLLTADIGELSGKSDLTILFEADNEKQIAEFYWYEFEKS